jgi:ABC-type taurine transport system ATPase subunit
LLVGELLSVDGVCRGFFRGETYLDVLKDVSFSVRSGGVVAITSRRRLAGKTTLLEIVTGMQMPDSGTVMLDGREVRPPLSGWRAGLDGRRGRPAAPKLGHDIVWVSSTGPHRELEVSKYVGSPLAVHGRGDVRRLAAAALDRVGAQKLIGRSWGELSDWQRALVGIARGFAGRPQLVVIDDLLDWHNSSETEELSDLLHTLIEEAERPCAVLLTAGQEAGIVLADELWSITPAGTLVRRSGPRPNDDATILPFPTHGEKQGSRRTGSG